MSKRGRGATPWKAVTYWADVRERIEAEVIRAIPSCSPDLFPQGIISSQRLALPWADRFAFPFYVSKTGNTCSSLFLKFLMYAIKCGGDRVVWIDSAQAKTPETSFFGVVRVLIPAADRKAYSALCDVFPLKCEFIGETGPRKTLDKNLKLAGMIERVAPCTGDVELLFDAAAHKQVKDQLVRGDIRRRQKRMDAVASRALRPLIEVLMESAAPVLTSAPRMAVSFVTNVAESDVVIGPRLDETTVCPLPQWDETTACPLPQLDETGTHSACTLPHLAEALGWNVGSQAELVEASNRAREAEDRLRIANEALQRANDDACAAREELDRANELVRSVRAKLGGCA